MNKKENMPEVKNTQIVELRSENIQQFVTFYFGEHFFGLPIDDVIEINRALETTPVPLAPSYVLAWSTCAARY
jgi:purine-binding chemotaxis protein CheW